MSLVVQKLHMARVTADLGEGFVEQSSCFMPLKFHPSR
jgi:hypothetical protein